MKRKNEFLYQKFANIIREQIRTQLLKPGDFLMSENELARHYGLSRISVRKSLEILAEEGLIVKKAGLGSMVATRYVPEQSKRKTFHIVAATPSHYVDFALGLIIEAFEKEHPQVDVKLMNMSSFNFWNSVQSLIHSDSAPDLLFVTDRQYKEIKDNEPFRDLTHFITYTKRLFYPKLLENFSEDSKLRALPITFSPVFLAYNPELFEQSGIPHPQLQWGMSELLDASAKLTQDVNGDGIPDIYGFSLSPVYTRWPIIALQNGVDFYQLSEHKLELHRTLACLHDLLYLRKSAIMHVKNRNSNNIEPFVTENAGMMLTTTLELGAWRDDPMLFEPKTVPIAFGPHSSTMLVANAFMIHEKSREHELAAAFCKMAIRRDIQEKISRATTFLSPLQPVNEGIWDKSYLSSINLRDSRLANGKFVYEVFPSVSFINEMEYEMGLFWAGLETVEGVVERLIRIPIH